LRPIIDAMQKWGKDYKKLKKLMDKANSIQE
jgi:DNA-binding HxlR family transcriptional regulator